MTPKEVEEFKARARACLVQGQKPAVRGKRKNRAHRLRNVAAQGLDKLIKERGGRCEFCGIAVLRDRHVISFQLSADKLHYVMPDGSLRGRATTEHIRRIVDGGGNKKSNKKLCCASCNSLRNTALQTKFD